ncbi:MAG TPA: DtxR family transcriptional regulator [Sedimentisphaerales bacterium]|nr:DtxR family transcriptional regulator [Sedimentisphaerales bacterium]
MSSSAGLSPSLENYLEAIFNIVAEKGVARTRDICLRLGIQAGSVTGALQSLSREGCINYAPHELVTLTESGRATAARIVFKHNKLRQFLVEVLELPRKDAETIACSMEHYTTVEMAARLAAMTDFFANAPELRKRLTRCMAEAVQSCRDGCEMNSITAEGNQIMVNSANTVTLMEAAPGRKYTILKVHGRSTVARRLTEMGAGKGAEVLVERVAPLGDPIEIKVRGYRLSVRRSEAKNIEVVVK